jgi:large subunit ribosomal protein L28
MSRVCDLCGRGTTCGNNRLPRRGLPKKKGGAGSKIGTKTRRSCRINLQVRHQSIAGQSKRMRICTKCLRAIDKPEIA